MASQSLSPGQPNLSTKNSLTLLHTCSENPLSGNPLRDQVFLPPLSCLFCRELQQTESPPRMLFDLSITRTSCVESEKLIAPLWASMYLPMKGRDGAIHVCLSDRVSVRQTTAHRRWERHGRSLSLLPSNIYFSR